MSSNVLVSLHVTLWVIEPLETMNIMFSKLPLLFSKTDLKASQLYKALCGKLKHYFKLTFVSRDSLLVSSNKPLVKLRGVQTVWSLIASVIKTYKLTWKISSPEAFPAVVDTTTYALKRGEKPVGKRRILFNIICNLLWIDRTRAIDQVGGLVSLESDKDKCSLSS